MKAQTRLTPTQIEPYTKIQHAYQLARIDGKPRYIAIDSEGAWFTTAEQPSATKSHWRVESDGTTTAHVNANRNGIYQYEKLPD